MTSGDCCDRIHIGMRGLFTRSVHIFFVSSLNFDYFDNNC